MIEKGYSAWLLSTYNQLISPQQCLSCMRWDQWETQSDRRSPISWSPDIWNPTVTINKHSVLIYNSYNKLLLHNKEIKVCSQCRSTNLQNVWLIWGKISTAIMCYPNINSESSHIWRILWKTCYRMKIMCNKLCCQFKALI